MTVAADQTPTAGKRMRLRYAGACRECGQSVPRGEWATYYRDSKTIACDSCTPAEAPHAPTPPTTGGPDNSATSPDVNQGLDPEPELGKRMRLRKTGTCRSCSRTVHEGEPATYYKASHTIACRTCTDGTPEATWRASQSPVDTDLPITSEVVASAVRAAAEPATPGTPGGYARERHNRITAADQAARAARAEAHPILGRLTNALTPEPTTSWGTGATGEEHMGARLNKAAAKHGIHVLHDRRIPGHQANIDHVAVTPTGVHVIDTKHRPKTHPRLRNDSKGQPALYLDDHRSMNLLDPLLWETSKVREALDAAGLQDIPVHPVLAFVGCWWPTLGGDFTINGVYCAWPSAVAKRVARNGPFRDEALGLAHRALADAFSPA